MVKQTVEIAAKSGIGGSFANTSGFVNNALVGQAVGDRRFSWLRRLTCGRKTVSPKEEAVYQTDNATGKKKLRKFSMGKKTNWSEGGRIFEIFLFLFFVPHRKAGVFLKRYF